MIYQIKGGSQNDILQVLKLYSQDEFEMKADTTRKYGNWKHFSFDMGGHWHTTSSQNFEFGLQSP